MQPHQHAAGCGCSNEDVGEKFSLYRFVNVMGLSALNAVDPSRLKDVLRPEQTKTGSDWEHIFVESDDEDPQMILIIPFAGSVRLRKIVILATGDSCPTEVRLFKNHNVSFDTDVAPTQVLQLGDDPRGELEYPLTAPKFTDVRTLSLFFPDSVGGLVTRIYYIGLLGEFTPAQAKLTGVVYESKPQLKDHQTRADETGSQNLGM